MTYALTFATRALFDAALASGGSIATLMNGVTSANPSVAITAFITESGESFSCGTNIMIDIKSVGPGDYVLRDTTNNKFFGIASKWIDNNYPAQPTQHIMIYKASVLPARYIVCGTVVKRFGNKIRVAGQPASKPWSQANSTSGQYEWNVSTLTSYTSVLKKSGTTTTTINANSWCAFPSLRYQENYFSSGNADYFPITRATWNSAVTAGNSTVTQNSKTVTLADFDYDFDKYLAYNFSPKFPAASGCYADTNGISNTRNIVVDFVANHSKSSTSTDYAAGYCYNYSVNAPGMGAHQWFLGTIKDMGEVRALTHTLLTPITWGSGYLWSSTQYSGTGAWGVNGPGRAVNPNKYNEFSVVPLVDITLPV